MKRRVCITGIGVVNPSGIGKEVFWDKVSQGINSISKITRFPISDFPVQVAGQLKNFNCNDYVPKRFSVKVDTFTHYAWAAASMAIKDANIDLATYDPYKVGAWLGNNAGGWDICERGLYEMYRDGVAYVNPWQATAWFLASPQGYLTIANNIKGMSKSFVCDRASGASAIYFAVQALQFHYNDVILCGGTEAPITAFAMNCYYETGQLAPALDDNTAYKPFDKNNQGCLLGEGSTILILEERESAIKRGAHIYGEILSATINTDFDSSKHDSLAKALKKSIANANLNVSDIDVIFAEGAGTKESDTAEASAIRQVFEKHLDIPISVPKSGFGHLYGASTATDIAAALLGAERELIPPTPNFCASDQGDVLNIVTKLQNKKIKNFIVNSRAREGSNVVLVITTKQDAF